VLARTVAAADGPLTVYGATSLEPAARAEQHFAHVLMVGLPLLVLFAAALIWWGVGRALAPVEEMRSMVDRIETEALGRTEGSRPRQRVGVRRQGDEIGRLGATLNHLLDRLDDSARRQRVFAAAASHELRSPLSAIRTELEVGLAYPERTDWGVVAEESLIEVQRLEHLAADLLQLTRLQAGATGSEGGAAAESYDLADVVRGEVPRRQPPCGVELRTELRSAPVVADRDLLLQVLRNLLANAERHARSRVVTTTSRIADSAVLRVWNDGQPIADCDQERIFHPFTRLDDGRALDGGGSGLGLAIARAAAEQLGGTLTAVPVEHGAAFEATFPSSTEGGWG
jgi:signal transduction histidine kinase